jgi:hypothetical protein
MNPLRNCRGSQSGQSLIQVLIAVAIMGILMTAMTSMFEISNKRQGQSNLTFQAGMVRSDLVSALNNPVAWKNTTTDSANNFASGTMLDCLNNGKPCTTDQTTDLSSGGTPVGFSGGTPLPDGVQIKKVFDSSGAVILDSTLPNAGYTPQGARCSTFNAAAGAGDDSCPLRFEVHWWAKCNSIANTCVNAQAQLQVAAIYNPGKQSYAFNPANYGTPKFLQGQEPGGLCWQLVDTSLYENCAKVVGIGTTTPQVMLQIGPASSGSSFGFDANNIDPAVNGTNDYFSKFTVPGFLMATNRTGGNNETDFVNFTASSGAGSVGGFAFYAANLGTAPDAPIMLMTKARNVGIGTANPGAPLHIYGGDTSDAYVTLGPNMPALNNGLNVAYGGATFGAGISFLNAHSASGNSAQLRFQTDFTTRMTIGSTGNVGIGTSTPSNLLSLNVTNAVSPYNTARIGITNQDQLLKIFSYYQPSVLQYGAIQSRNAADSGNTNLVFQPQGGNVGVGVVNPSYALHINGNVAAQGFFHTSDKREKTNIVPLGEAASVLDRLASVHGVYFDWKKTGEKSIGVIAQDLTRDFPELVNRRDEKHWTVNYGGLTAVVLEAVKELRNSLQKSEARMAALESRNRSQEAEIARLRAELETLSGIPTKPRKE